MSEGTDARPDNPTADGANDSSKDQGATDLPPDKPHDLRPPDVSQPPDTTPDAPPDAMSDLVLPPACAIGTRTFTYQADMVICEDGQERNQCEAHQLCNESDGWKLCPATEFRARGGTTEQGTNIPMAWITGCIEPTANGFNAPKDEICDCALSYPPSRDIEWRCNDSASNTGFNRVHGIVTANDCWRVGQDIVDTEAYWNAHLPWYKRETIVGGAIIGAVCCL